MQLILRRIFYKYYRQRTVLPALSNPRINKKNSSFRNKYFQNPWRRVNIITASIKTKSVRPHFDNVNLYEQFFPGTNQKLKKMQLSSWLKTNDTNSETKKILEKPLIKLIA